MYRIVFATAVVLATTSFCHAEVLVWDFSIDEQQIRNGPEPDGSTNSPGTGTGRVEYDTGSNVLSYSFDWDGLFGELTKLHIHGPADANSNNPQHLVEIFGPPDVPAELIATSGSWSDSMELKTLEQAGFDPISPSFIIDTMSSGNAYLNVHTTVFGMGEIRGNLGVPVPEPSVSILVWSALLFVRRLRR